jgi:hypothetical protein
MRTRKNLENIVSKDSDKSNSGYSLFDSFADAARGVVFGWGWPYMLPTALRASSEGNKIKDKEAFDVGYASGVVGIMMQVALYASVIEKGHPEAFLLPLAANIFSALYEGARAVIGSYVQSKNADKC